MNSIERGGYVMFDASEAPEAVLIATGSEVSLAITAAKLLAQEGYKVRVVSMPSTNVFDRQPESYRDSVLPRSVQARVAVETAHPEYWRKYVGLAGKVIGISTFGESAPGAVLLEHFGFTEKHIVGTVKELLVK